jgi:hypothetical protein
MASSAEQRAEMGRRGHEIYQCKFDYDHWISRTVEVMGGIQREFMGRHS